MRGTLRFCVELGAEDGALFTGLFLPLMARLGWAEGLGIPHPAQNGLVECEKSGPLRPGFSHSNGSVIAGYSGLMVNTYQSVASPSSRVALTRTW